MVNKNENYSRTKLRRNISVRSLST